MTLHNMRSGVGIECDGNRCTESIEARDFNTAWSEMKEAGWKASKQYNEWFHYCAECSKQGKPDLKALMGE